MALCAFLVADWKLQGHFAVLIIYSDVLSWAELLCDALKQMTTGSTRNLPELTNPNWHEHVVSLKRMTNTKGDAGRGCAGGRN